MRLRSNDIGKRVPLPIVPGTGGTVGASEISVLETLLDYFERFSERVPLEVFAFLGSFFEEVIAPVPSPFIMTLAGSIAKSQGHAFWYLFVVAIIAAAGKTLGAGVLYVVADRSEDVLMSRVGRFVGISSAEVERFGARLSGSRRDFLVLLLIRSTPVIPSAPISIICGFIKVHPRMFLIATFFGTIVRDLSLIHI
jgi:membrane protein DedA with SNARE-associated domain